MNTETTNTQNINYEATAHYYDAALTTIRHYVISSMENGMASPNPEPTLTLIATIIDECRENAKTQYNYE